MSNLTRVDFKNKRRQDFVETNEVSREEFVEAVEKVNKFMKTDYKAKSEQYSALEQVMLHTIEDASEDKLVENAVDLILSLHDIRNTRRDMKQCQEVKEVAAKKLNVSNSSHLANEVKQKSNYQDRGSSEKYYQAKVRRIKSGGYLIDEDKMEKALFKHILTPDNKEEA